MASLNAHSAEQQVGDVGVAIFNVGRALSITESSTRGLGVNNIDSRLRQADFSDQDCQCHSSLIWGKLCQS